MAGVTCASLAHAAQASAAKTTEKFRDAQAQLLNAAPQQHRAENVCAREHIQNPPRHALTYLPPSLPSYSQESPFLFTCWSYYCWLIMFCEQPICQTIGCRLIIVKYWTPN
eukprot:scaffold135031_cov19-Tisochrysis_lutea.AAC.5